MKALLRFKLVYFSIFMIHLLIALLLPIFFEIIFKKKRKKNTFASLISKEFKS